MPLRIPLGIDDFRQLRERGLEYIDKSHLITELLDHEGVKVVVLPRPRRFGKTINLSMLRWFFEERDEDLWQLFEDLYVARAGEAYRAHFQQYPVIHLSFKGTKATNFELCLGQIREIIRALYGAHRACLEGRLDERQRADFHAVWMGTADEALYRRSLLNLTEYLHQVRGKRPIVLIDEYDAPIHAGFANGYYDDVVDFFRSLFELGLKDNPHLERTVMTGILRVSKESIFSGLNNAGVYTLLAEEFNTCFGFTEAEVAALLQKAGLSELMDSVRSYYNGYEFGGEAIYNPWSILSFLNSKTKQLVPHWLTTSSNELIKELLLHHAFTVESDLRTLLEGGSIEREVSENIVFAELTKQEDALWSILVFSGYLRAARGPVVIGQPQPPFQLSIPNREIAEVYRTTFQFWMDKGLHTQGGGIRKLLTSLLGGNTREFEKQLQMFSTYLVSYHDVGEGDPERFYQGLMIGLFAALEPEYEVRSNRESGEGRPDLLIKPRAPGKPGVVLELKTARRDERTIEQALREGLRQARKHDYAAELRAAGVEKIHQMVVAFDGKRVIVETADAPQKKGGALRKIGASIQKAAKKVAPARTRKAKRKN